MENEKIQYGVTFTVDTPLEAFGDPIKNQQEVCELLGRRIAKRVDVMIAEIAVKFSDEVCPKCRKRRKGKCSGPLLTPCRKSKRAVRKGLMAKVKEMRHIREANNETD